MSPNTWTRIYRVLHEDPTALLEFVVTVCYTLLQGMMLLIGQSVVASPAAETLAAFGFTSARFGGVLVLLGLAQVCLSGTERYALRGWVAFVIGCNALGVILAYIFAGVTERFVLPFLIGTVLVESFLAARCWAEGAAHKQTAQPMMAGGARGGTT